MKVFDMHADTPYKMFSKNVGFSYEGLHISLDKLKNFSSYNQIFAFWCDNEKSDEEVYSDFFKMRKHFLESMSECAPKNLHYYFSIEDARLLEGKLERVPLLYSLGVRILTLVWRGESIIGGAYDTEKGLTEFGKMALDTALDVGIIPDVSHASRKVTDEVCKASAEKKVPFIATHSNSYSVYKHKRNLLDEEFLRIKDSSGIVGISLAPEHLCENEAHIKDVIKHVEHYLSLGGEDTLCLGCDFDGIESTPKELSDVSKLYLLKEELLRLGYSENLTDKIFYKNANDFVLKYINE